MEAVFGDSVQRRMEHRCSNFYSSMYDVVLCLKLDEVDYECEGQALREACKLRVHTGKDPSVTIKMGKDYYVDILFTGDMERQLFISGMAYAYQERILELHGGCDNHLEDILKEDSHAHAPDDTLDSDEKVEEVVEELEP